jgi:methyl farnesoate epoxidase/farnesoate epoxidase
VSEGEAWESHRRFTLRHLRDFGFGKNRMENLIMEEVTEVLSSFKNQLDRPLVVDRNFTLAVLNALWTITSGERLPQNDKLLHNLLESAIT